MSALNRRSALTALAAAPVLSIPAIVTAAEPDPIFAAIEAHRAAFLEWCRLGEIASRTVDFGPDYCPAIHNPIHAAGREAQGASLDAAMELVNTVPTTMAGVLALIEYVADFNEGKFGYEEGWKSSPDGWPATGYFEFDFDAPEEDNFGMP